MAQVGVLQTSMLHTMHATMLFAVKQQINSAMQEGIQPHSGPKLRQVHGQTGYFMPVGQDAAAGH